MFRFSENLVNPFAEFPQTTPPATLLAYIRSQLVPYKRLLPIMATVSVLVALIEAGLIFYTGRVIDLMIPFFGKTTMYDHPKFKGSASIKYVLPALVPHLSYKNMHIQEGGTASDTWNRIVSGEYSTEDKNMKTQALKDYCHLDTLAMVEIWRVLKSV